MSRSRETPTTAPTIAQVALIGLFVTALVTAQLTASKVLAFELPVALPITGAQLALPGAALAYALTFLASDCYTELYGKRAAQVVVNVGFALNVVVLALVWSTIAAPAADPDSAAQFATVLGSSTNIVLGSLLAYVVSQNWDVVVFHRIRDYTGSGMLWLRNIGSTASSQAIDTVIFVAVGFVVAPAVLDVGMPPMGLEGALALMIGQYVLKLAIAILDTPIVYAVVHFVRSNDGLEAADVPS